MLAIVLVTVWSTGILFLLTDPHNHSSRWAGITSIVGGFGFLAGILDDELRPLVQVDSLKNGLHWTSNMASFLCQIGLPYAFLQFSLYACPYLPKKWMKFVGIAAILPILYMTMTTPILPELTIDYHRLAIWSIPYILFAVALLFYGFFKEKDPVMKRSRFVVLVIGAFPMLFVMVTIYVLRLFGWFEVWKYNVLILLLQFLFFIGFSMKFGVFGFKLRVEQNQMNTTMRALTSGTSILNHTIKNEVGKMQLLIYRLERWKDQRPEISQEIQQDIQDLYQSTEHMLDMVKRIQGKIRDIELKESLHSVEEQIENAIRQVEPFAQSKGTQLLIEQVQTANLWIDPVHLHEVLINVLRNAVEAITQDGVIRIRTYLSRKYYTIMIEDNGKGIAKGNLPHVFEPFFSTKKNQSTHFGLGLAYCYQVMRMHQGFMEMKSTEGVGTHVFLYFPRNRLKGVEQGSAAYSCDDRRG
ncbi:MAG TPA: HAMP domain-containing sensor histidine kinase [Bacillota bacterium]|nr:HAMP domain-containing sensor histidine kinase [Bacillota bacterium]